MKWAGVLQVVVLTDGETSGEEACRELARQAWEKKVRFTIMGVGTEWNSGLIKDLAKVERRPMVLHRRRADRRGRCAVFLAEFDRLARHVVRQRESWTCGRSRTSRSSAFARSRRRSATSR